MATMTGGEAFRAKILTDDMLDAAISAYLADPSAPAILEIGRGSLDIAAAVLAHQWSAEELAVEDATPARRRNAVSTAAYVALTAVLPLACAAAAIATLWRAARRLDDRKRR